MPEPEISDPLLGRLRYGMGSYEGEFTVESSPIGLTLELDERGEIAPALNRARQVLGEFERYARGAREFAAKELLELKNDSWLGEDEEPVTPEQFQARMTLDGLMFSADGEVIFFHRDGDLFRGHCIEIAMNGTDRFVDADIPG